MRPARGRRARPAQHPSRARARWNSRRHPARFGAVAGCVGGQRARDARHARLARHDPRSRLTRHGRHRRWALRAVARVAVHRHRFVRQRARVPGDRTQLVRHPRPVPSIATTRGCYVTRHGGAGGTATAAAAHTVTARALFDQQASQHPSPRQLSRPSLSATAAMTSAVSGSAHHQPAIAFAASPTSSAIER